jgi:hypothetical protein
LLVYISLSLLIVRIPSPLFFNSEGLYKLEV